MILAPFEAKEGLFFYPFISEGIVFYGCNRFGITFFSAITGTWVYGYLRERLPH